MAAVSSKLSCLVLLAVSPASNSQQTPLLPAVALAHIVGFPHLQHSRLLQSPSLPLSSYVALSEQVCPPQRARSCCHLWCTPTEFFATLLICTSSGCTHRCLFKPANLIQLMTRPTVGTVPSKGDLNLVCLSGSSHWEWLSSKDSIPSAVCLCL